MGKKLDALFGRNFKTAKFKPLVKFAISRLAVLKNQRQVRLNHSRSDVLQLLEQGLHERALLRVEYVIKDQSMVDVYGMIKGYCELLIERVHLLEQERECPEELNEAVSGLMFAASRCGDFPELVEICSILKSRFGKEFAARAIELRNNCGVNPKLIQKISTKMSTLESRREALKEIASEADIVLQLEDTPVSKEQVYANNQNQAKPDLRSEESSRIPYDKKWEDSGLSDSFTVKQKYKDVADAAQAAFESAAYAAAAARAAVELSRSEPHDSHDRSFKPSPSKIMSGSQETKEHVPRSEQMESDHQARELKIGKNEAVGSYYTRISSSENDQTKVSANATIGDGHVEDEVVFEQSHDESDDKTVSSPSSKETSSCFTDMKVVSGQGDPQPHAISGSGFLIPMQLGLEKKPFSVRTR